MADREKVSIESLLNRLNESQPINIRCDTMAQLRALKHIQDSFSPKGVKKLELIDNGIRLTDMTGIKGDFISDPKTGDVYLKE